LSACVAGWRDVVNVALLVEAERMLNDQVAVWLVMVRWRLGGWVVLWVDVMAMLVVRRQQLGMDMLVVVVCLVPKVVSKACVDTSSLLKTPYAP
jgi:hypothetical protein